MRAGEGPARRGPLALGLIVALPLIVSTLRAVLNGWTPVFDDGVMATRAFDVFSAHSPLVGVYSDATAPALGPVYGAGPMLFWLLALQTHFLGDWALPVTIGAVNTASILGVVLLARQRGGQVLMFATAVATVAMLASLPAWNLHEPDNSRVGLIPFALLLFLAWSVASGESRLLPLLVLVASFVIQVHFTVAVAGAALFLVALLLCATRFPIDPRTRLISAGIAVICWTPAVLDQVIHSPGNIVRLWQTATFDRPKAGLGTGWRVVEHAIGIAPKWMQPYPGAATEIYSMISATSTVRAVSTLLVLGLLFMASVLGARRRRSEVTTAVALVWVVILAMLVVSASLPAPFTYREYAVFWTSPAGMFCWLLGGWSLVTLFREDILSAARSSRGRLATRRAGALRRLATPPVGFLAVGIIAIAATLSPPVDPLRWAFRPTKAISHGAEPRLRRDRGVLVMAAPSSLFSIQWGIMYRLRRDGYRAVAPDGGFSIYLADRLGGSYLQTDPATHALRYRDLLNIGLRGDGAAPRGTTIVRTVATGVPGAGGPSVLVASIARTPSAPSAPACPPAPTALSITAAQLPRIEAGRVAGSIDGAQIRGQGLTLCGWAADVRHRRVAQAVLVEVGNHAVAAARVAMARPDVAQAYRGLSLNSGFSLTLPLRVLRTGGRRPQLVLYAISEGRATPLAVNCKLGHQDFGC